MSAARRAALAIAVTLAAGAPPSALGQDHGGHVHAHGEGGGGLVTVRLDPGFGAIAQEHRYGSYTSLALTADLMLPAEVSLSALLPTYRVDFDGSRRSGLGDAALAVSRGLTAGGVRVTLSAMAHLPTGSAARGLGSGHAMVMFGASASTGDGPWRFGASLADATAATTREHDHTVLNLVTPHAMHELFYGGWTAWTWRSLEVRLAVSAQSGLSSEAVGRDIVAPSLTASGGLGDGWRLGASASAPVTTSRYFEWQASLSLSRGFATWPGAGTP